MGDITFASASYDSPYGKITSNWKRDDRHFYLDVEIPANTTAHIYFPNGEWKTITENGKKVKTKIGANGRISVKIGSGKYNFVLEF